MNRIHFALWLSLAFNAFLLGLVLAVPSAKQEAMPQRPQHDKKTVFPVAGILTHPFWQNAINNLALIRAYGAEDILSLLDAVEAELTTLKIRSAEDAVLAVQRYDSGSVRSFLDYAYQAVSISRLAEDVPEFGKAFDTIWIVVSYGPSKGYGFSNVFLVNARTGDVCSIFDPRWLRIEKLLEERRRQMREQNHKNEKNERP